MLLAHTLAFVSLICKRSSQTQSIKRQCSDDVDDAYVILQMIIYTCTEITQSQCWVRVFVYVFVCDIVAYNCTMCALLLLLLCIDSISA